MAYVEVSHDERREAMATIGAYCDRTGAFRWWKPLDGPAVLQCESGSTYLRSLRRKSSTHPPETKCSAIFSLLGAKSAMIGNLQVAATLAVNGAIGATVRCPSTNARDASASIMATIPKQRAFGQSAEQHTLPQSEET